ncbi:MAG: hypothetical protein DRP03_03835 [Candidatus Aenigmatarchaeota archaeon]|nr:MAG: hypothetical protein DRP03_03835 [Candidatus Aenigmarchaeota archaeon]
MAEVIITMPVKYTIILDKSKITLTENHRVVFLVDLEKIPWCASIGKLKDFIYTFLDNAIQEYLSQLSKKEEKEEENQDEEKKGADYGDWCEEEDEDEELPWWEE